MRRSGSIFASALLLALSACAGPKPCRSGGDVTWEPPVTGDRECLQRREKSGRWVNHGKFIQYDENYKVIVEGMFKMGEKDGVWVQYTPDGRKIKEKYFEEGVEKAFAPKPEPEPEPPVRSSMAAPYQPVPQATPATVPDGKPQSPAIAE